MSNTPYGYLSDSTLAALQQAQNIYNNYPSMLRYGFDFEDIEWIKPCVASIDKTEIVFNDKVDSLSEEQLMRIDRFR